MKDGFQIWKNLNLPLLQFNRSCQRVDDKDKIIDFSICLESTLLYGVNKELGYRLALRAAMLCKNTRTTTNTFEFIKSLYDIRSKVVHENQPLSHKKISNQLRKINAGMNIHDYLNEADLLMRDILIQVVERISTGKSLKQLCTDLDTEILSAIAA